MRLHARFVKQWVIKEYADGFTILDARGVYVCGLSTREDLHKAGWTLSEKISISRRGPRVSGGHQ